MTDISSKRIQYVIKITYLFAIVGTFANILFNIINQHTATASEVSLGISGAGFIFATMFSMMFLQMKNGSFNESGISSIKKILLASAKLIPTIATFVITVLYFSLNATYADNINSNNVASEYKTYSILGSIMLFIQTLVVGHNLNQLISPNEDANGTDKYSSINKLLVILLFFILNLYVYGISKVILKFFTTDG